MSEPYVGAIEWARTVKGEEPHGLRDLEDVVLWKHPDNGARLRWDERSSVGLYGLFVLAYAFAAIAPVVGPAVFSGATYRGVLGNGQVEVDSAFPVTAVAFSVGVIFLVGMLVQWWRARRRSAAIILISGLSIVCGVLTLAMANGYADQFSGNATLHLVPVWIAIALGVVVAVAHLRSPAIPGRARLTTEGLSEESRSLLLEERTEALRVLSGRGLLVGEDVASLRARPLGKLHVAPEDAHAQ